MQLYLFSNMPMMSASTPGIRKYSSSQNMQFPFCGSSASGSCFGSIYVLSWELSSSAPKAFIELQEHSILTQ
jgi:hypothetical protein